MWPASVERCANRDRKDLQVLLSLTYQPAFNNLTIVLLKARNLTECQLEGSAGEGILSSIPADPYVKFYLRAAGGERIGKKKKSQVKRGTLYPG